MDVVGEFVSYDEYMTRVYIADAKTEERSALRQVLLDLKMSIAGEAVDWATTLTQAPITRADMLLIDWDLLPNSPTSALETLRKACPAYSHQPFGRPSASCAFRWCRCIYQ